MASESPVLAAAIILTYLSRSATVSAQELSSVKFVLKPRHMVTPIWVNISSGEV